jgi:hypothetical protein
MAAALETVWVVRHTFLEVQPTEECVGRRRTMSDTEFLLPETPKSQCNDSAARDLDEIMSVASTHAPVEASDDEPSTPSAGKESRSPTLCWADESDDEPAIIEEEKTTVMLRNVPYNVTRDSVTKMMDDAGFKGEYDFIYMPIDFRSKSGFGYAFINLVSCAAAERFFAHFNGFGDWAIKSQKVAEVTWTESNQGLDVHVERYRNSPVMHEVVPDEFKPAMFKDGVRVAFPPPTKAIRAPRFRHR